MRFNSEILAAITRRHFFKECGTGLGTMALASLFNERLACGCRRTARKCAGRKASALFAEGQEHHLPVHGRRTQPAGPVRLQAPAAAAPWTGHSRRYRQRRTVRFYQGNAQAAGLSVPLQQAWRVRVPRFQSSCPTSRTVVDDIAVVRSVVTDAFNHAPAQLFVNTGSTQFGRPSMGSWVTYGLGTESRDLPGFVVLISGGGQPDGGTSCWGSGFLPTFVSGRAIPIPGRSRLVPFQSLGHERCDTAAVVGCA